MSYMTYVKEIVTPHANQSFKLFKAGNDDTINMATAMRQLSCTAMIWLNNIMGEAIQQAVNTYRNHQDILLNKMDDLDLSGKIIYCDGIVHNYLMSNPTFNDARNVIVTQRHQMDQQLILLTPTVDAKPHVLEYSFSMTPVNKLEPDVMAELILDLEFFLATTAGIHYTCAFPEA